MADLRDLYQEVILEHSKTPRNYRELTSPLSKSGGIQSALRRSLHGVSADAGGFHSRYRFSRFGLRHLQGVGLDDDAELERQDPERSRRPLSSFSQRGHRPDCNQRRPSRARQAGCVLGRFRVPVTSEMRHPGMAHPASGPRREAGRHFHRVTIWSRTYVRIHRSKARM